MKLEEFKTQSDEQLKAYGELIPLGYIYDSNNYNLLTFKDSCGYWTEYTYDTNNNILTSKNLNGYWPEPTYNNNPNNKQLTYKNSKRYWREYTYDTTNNLLTYKDSTGVDKIVLIKGVKYTLWYAIDSNKYVAGCKELSYTECLEFFIKFKDKHKDSNLFLEAIEKHQLTLS